MNCVPKRDHNHNSIMIGGSSSGGAFMISPTRIKREVKFSLIDNVIVNSPPHSRLINNSMRKVPSMSDLLDENSLGKLIIIELIIIIIIVIAYHVDH